MRIHGVAGCQRVNQPPLAGRSRCISIACAVVDASAAAATIASITGVLGSRGGALTGRLNQALGSLGGGTSSNKGTPVEGLGVDAHWEQTSATSSVLTANKNGRVLNIKIDAPNMPPNDQLAWVRAFAMAGLPAV